MGFWQEITNNQVLISAGVAWAAAQLLKTIIDFSLNKSFRIERLVGTGGMPSSHSSTVCALLVSSGLCYGVGSFAFASSLVLAAIVMSDAIGVRQETGKQAKLLNFILEQDLFKFDNQEFQKRLKEFVGHTPLQVFAGALLGIGLAFLVNIFYT